MTAENHLNVALDEVHGYLIPPVKKAIIAAMNAHADEARADERKKLVAMLRSWSRCCGEPSCRIDKEPMP